MSKGDIKLAILLLLIITLSGSLAAGMEYGLYDKCYLYSRVAKYNPLYRLGCFLTLPVYKGDR